MPQGFDKKGANDGTEHRADEAPRNCEQQLQDTALFPEQNPYPVLRVGRDGRLLYANPSSARLLEAWGCEVGLRVPDEIRQRVTRALNTSEVCEAEVECGSVTYLFSVAPIRGLGYANLYGMDISERKQAEKYLGYYELLAAQSRDIILFVRRGDGRILEANPAALNAYGYDREELLSSTIHDLRAPETQALTASQIEEADERGIIFETIHRRKGGTIFPVEVSLRGGTVHGNRVLISVVHDITGRKAVQTALQQSEERFRMLAGATFEGIAVTEGGRMLDVNDQLCKILGYDRSELIGTKISKMLPPEEQDRVLANIAEGRETVIEHQVVRKDGSTRMVEAHGKTLPQAGRSRRFTAIRDITDRKAVEEASRESERLYRAIGESIDYGVWVCAPDGRNLYTSGSFLKLVGMTQEDFSNFGWDDVLHPDDAERTRAGWKERLQTGGTWDIEYRVRGVDRQWHAILARGVPVKNDRGELTCWAGINLDISSLKRVEMELQRRGQELEAARTEAENGRRRLEAVMDSLPVGVAITDTRGGNIHSNRAFEQVWGGPRPSTRSVDDYEAYLAWWVSTGERLSPEEWASARALRTGEPVIGQFLEIQRFDGARAFVINSASPVRGVTGEIVGTAVALQDITALRKTEEALQHSLHRLELLSHTADVLLRAINPQEVVNELCEGVMEHLGCHTFFNFLADEEAGRLRLNAYAGIPDEEGRKIAWLDYGVAVCGCAARDACRIVAEHIPTTADERTELVKSYGIKAYACHPLLGPGGKVIGTLSFGTRDRETFSEEDLSLMKAVADLVAVAMIRMQDEQALRAARDQLEQRVSERTAQLLRQAELLDLSHDAIFVRDVAGTITFWNAGASALYGWSREETEGRISYELLRTVFPRSNDELVAELLLSGRWEGELRQRTRDGREITVSSRWALQRDEFGRAAGIMETNRDVTEQRRLQEQLQQSQKMEAIGTLAGGIAHDFNNMLAAIMGNAELALDDVDPAGSVYQNLSQIVKATIRARGLVKEILTFSRKSEKDRAPLRLMPLVEDTYNLLRASLPSTIEMNLRRATTEDVILANASQVQQVLMNLVMNAAQAMPEGGGLEISLFDARFHTTHAVPDPDMALGDYLVLAVQDTGSGMTEEVRRRIFDPFFTTKEQGRGTGLGLAVVYGIVKAHGGAITVTSLPGAGSTFKVYLPKAETEAEILTHGDRTVAKGTGTVLFVDDEQLLREMVEGMLSRLGYTVTTESDPRAALALFERDPRAFDVVITDQTMPGMTGLALSSQLLRIRPDLPIILCTGHSEKVSERTFRTKGIREFLMKPLTRQELAEALTRALAKP